MRCEVAKCVNECINKAAHIYALHRPKGLPAELFPLGQEKTVYEVVNFAA